MAFDLYFAQKPRNESWPSHFEYCFAGGCCCFVLPAFLLSKTNTTKFADTKSAPQNNSAICRIAYFEMDSVENSFKLFKDVKSELGREEDRMNNEMAHLEKQYRDRINQFQNQAPTMTQVQSENANREVIQMQQQPPTKQYSK